jgi:hypothetical protein
MTWYRLVVPTLASGFLLVAAAMGPGASTALNGLARLEVYHFSSEVTGTEFQEVFIVTATRPAAGIAMADVQWLRDGEPLTVTWDQNDGRISVGDRFWFVQEAFDQKQTLTARLAGRQILECRYGGGAGLPVLPSEWIAMGQPEQIRCLQQGDDFAAHH